MKAYTAAPPDVLRGNEKYLRQYYVQNCCAVIITTNHKADGLYLPADDRRHYVAWSTLVKENFQQTYWEDLWGWYNHGGDQHVATFLAGTDISAFNAKAPPPQTAAFWDIVNANRSSEDAELADILDELGNPIAVTLSKIASKAEANFAEWLRDRKNRRAIPYRLEECGYVPVRNPDAKRDGLWKIGGKRQVVYAVAKLSIRDQLAAVRNLFSQSV